MANRIERVTICWILMVVVGIFFVTQPMAKDWHELSSLSDEQLSARISESKEILEQNCDDYESIKCLGIAYHIKAQKDPKKFVKKAVEALSRAHEMNKEDYEVLCYLGSATTMRAKTTWNLIKKRSYANKGITMMDKSVRRAPDNVSVRMTRAYNSKNLPGFLGRGDIALEDFEYLAKMIEKDPNTYKAIKREVYENLAELYQKQGEGEKAEEYMQLAKGT